MFSKDRLRYHLYRLQQRLSITRRESIALGLILGMLFVGTLVQTMRQPPLEFDPSYYAVTDSAFEAATAAFLGKETLGTDSTMITNDSLQIQAEGVINLNTASKLELESLPRIGPAMADRILAYRIRHGKFRRVEELMEVRGIGPKTFAGLAPLITVDE